MAKAAKPVPNGFHTVTVQLTLDNAAETIDWSAEFFKQMSQPATH